MPADRVQAPCHTPVHGTALLMITAWIDGHAALPTPELWTIAVLIFS